MSTGSSDRFLKLEQVADLLGWCVRTVRRQSQSGELPRLIKVGNSTRMSEAEIRAYMDRKKQERKWCRSLSTDHRGSRAASEW